MVWDLRDRLVSNVDLVRDFHDSELDEVLRLFEILSTVEVNRGSSARILWDKGKDGKFSVGVFFNSLHSSERSFFPASHIWISKIPSKISFFLWTATHKKCLYH